MNLKKRTNMLDSIKAVILDAGYVEDKWGKFTKTVDGDKYRYNFTKIGLRYEVRSSDGGWIRLRSAYIKDISVVNNKIVGLKYN